MIIYYPLFQRFCHGASYGSSPPLFSLLSHALRHCILKVPGYVNRQRKIVVKRFDCDNILSTFHHLCRGARARILTTAALVTISAACIPTQSTTFVGHLNSPQVPKLKFPSIRTYPASPSTPSSVFACDRAFHTNFKISLIPSAILNIQIRASTFQVASTSLAAFLLRNRSPRAFPASNTLTELFCALLRAF